MVTLAPEPHQQTSVENHHQKDQDRIAPVEGRDTKGHSVEVTSPVKVSPHDTVVANGSVGDSSTQCSEVGYEDEYEEDEVDGREEEEEDTDIEEGEWMTNMPVAAVVQQQQIAIANGDLVLPNADPSNFGDICVKNSTNVHLGNKTFYKGPVTIKQFVYSSPTSAQGQESSIKCDSGRISDANASDLSTCKDDSSGNRPMLPRNLDYDKVTQWLWTWRCAALLCTVALVLVTAVVISSVLLTRTSDGAPDPVFPEIPYSSLEGVTVTNVRFVERNEWGAQPPTEILTKLKLPVPYVIISHTATEFCTTQSECTFHVRFAQTFHIESRKWSDIAYNFLVGGDGLAYVGRSWNFVGAHSFGFNNRSIGISFIGTFNSVIPPKSQIYAAQRIIELGVEAGKIAKDYKLLGHRQISTTLSPGDALYSAIKKWPHWAPNP